MIDQSQSQSPIKISGGKEFLLNPKTESYLPVEDCRDKFARLTKDTPKDLSFERSFLTSKIRLTKMGLSDKGQETIDMLKTMLAQYPEKEERAGTSPDMGGVGYGFAYTDIFRVAYSSATILAEDIIAPTKAGGNVSNHLYLTATNRAAKGVEALVSYRAQNEMFFKIFDWARSDLKLEPWAVIIPASQMSDYFTQEKVHGKDYQLIGLQNSTATHDGTNWMNRVWLYNHRHLRYDLVYRFDYKSTETDQKRKSANWWGPIIETFQNSYSDTNVLGFSMIQLKACGTNAKWTPWRLLSDKQSTIMKPNHGFRLLFCDPNHTFAVH